MAVTKSLQPSEVWDYIQDNRDELREDMHLIASDDENSIDVFVSVNVDGIPYVIVEYMLDEIQEEMLVDESDCFDAISRIYGLYLSDSKSDISQVEYDEECGSDDEVYDDLDDELISERESELDDLIYEFIVGVVRGEEYDYDVRIYDVIDDLKEHFLEYMYRKHGIPIYRPMRLQYDDGSVVLENYPYENMEFEDENNPLYK